MTQKHYYLTIIFGKGGVIAVELNVDLKCKLPFALALSLKGPEDGKGINAVKQSLSGTKMLLFYGCEILPFGRSVLMYPLTGGSWGTRCFGAASYSAQTLTETSLGIAINSFCVTAEKALILEAVVTSIHWAGGIRASNWEQMTQALHVPLLCM